MQRPTTPKCSQCGMDLQADDRFCGHCGAPIADEIEKEQAYIATEKEAVTDVQETEFLPEAHDAAEGKPEVDLPPVPPTRSKGRGRRKLWVVLVVLLLMGAGLFALTHFHIVDLDQGLVSKIMQRLQSVKKSTSALTDYKKDPENPFGNWSPEEKSTPTVADYKRDIKEAWDSYDYTRMENYITAGLSRYPRDPDLLYWQVVYFMNFLNYASPDSRKKAALKAASKALKINQDVVSYFLMGWIHQMLYKDYSKALSYYKEVTSSRDISIKTSRFFYFMGICYQKQGRRALAKEHYRRYLKVAPKGEYAADARSRLSRL